MGPVSDRAEEKPGMPDNRLSYAGRRFGALLVESGVVTEDGLKQALERQRATGERLGEALVGLFIAAVVFARDQMGETATFWAVPGFETAAPWLAIPVFAILALYLVRVPLSKAGRPEEPAPPSAMM